MTKEDKQIINRATKENWRIGDRTRLKRLLWENLKLYRENVELENKIADIKANCDLAIEGRDIKIKELEQELTVEKDQHQEETNLHLHAEEYIKSLEQQIEKMKCCPNCDFMFTDGNCYYDKECKNKDHWKLRRVNRKCNM